jgi:hypothetical protein
MGGIKCQGGAVGRISKSIDTGNKTIDMGNQNYFLFYRWITKHAPLPHQEGKNTLAFSL